nr:hypothetical protein [uncultured Flavobacterium sp.]
MLKDLNTTRKVIELTSKKLSLLQELEQTILFENENILFDLVQLPYNYMLFDKQGKELYYGSLTEIKKWLNLRKYDFEKKCFYS